MYLAECELQIAAQLGGPGWESEVRAAWEAAHTRMEATTLTKKQKKNQAFSLDGEKPSDVAGESGS